MWVEEGRCLMGRAVGVWLLVFGLVGFACKDQAEKTERVDKPGMKNEAVFSSPPKPDEHPKLPWIQDDFERAKNLAEKEKKPLVIDMWAGWCHTCLSMKNYVLNNPSLVALGDRFVWLEVDTETPRNTLLVAKYPPSVWPTFLVLGGKDYHVQVRHLGAASASQFREFVLLGERGHLESLAEEGSIDRADPLFLLRAGDRLALAGKPEQAHQQYLEALAKAPRDWSRKSEVLLAALSSLNKASRWSACLDFGLGYAEQLGNGPATADFFSIAEHCSLQIKRKDSRKNNFHTLGIKILESLERDPDAALSADDRSEVLRVLRQFYESLGDKTNARKAAQKQVALLDDAASKAPGPQAAATYNWPRAEVYVYLDRALEIVAALEKSVHDLPKHYDPPYRLAWVLYTLGDYDRAWKEAEKALKLAYGPRKARIHGLLTDIHLGRKDLPAALTSARNMLGVFKALPEGQKNRLAEKEARDKIFMIEKMRKRTD